MSGRIRSVSVVTVGLLALAAPSLAAPPAQESFIVVLEPGSSDVRAEAATLARQARGTVGFVYENALEGFSITASPAAARALERNPRVAYVETDDPVSIAAQEVPTGIDRSYASSNVNLDIDGTDDNRVDVDVAVIDTGIDIEHPDLDVVGGINCASGNWRRASCDANYDDDHYHGTHVAGTVAALDNNFGVVGVAPGARLHAVKVLNSRGSGYTSWIVAGIDWVAANADTVEVANMSLGGSGYNQAEYDAIQGAVDAGVAFAVAAGNDNDDAINYSPAAFDNVLTVSALADFDGAAGGEGSPTCRTDQDDTLADFSNRGTAVDIAAPGVCIESTFPIEQGEYGTISGTSMASPHVAGALALLASTNSPAGAADVDSLYKQVKHAGNDKWTDDSGDATQEPLLDVNTFSAAWSDGSTDGGGDVTNAAPVAVFEAPSGCAVGSDCTFDGTASSDPDDDTITFRWDFGDGSTGSGREPSHAYGVGGEYTVTLKVDDGSLTDSTSATVVVAEPGTGGATLTTDSTNQGSTWTALVTGATSGSWDSSSPDTVASCVDSTCRLTGIAKKEASVLFTSGDGQTVMVAKP
jgi:subtilisin